MTVEQAIRDRVSVKEYTSEPVDRGRIERLLELALLAPNHRMTQPLEFRVMGPAAEAAYAEALAARKMAKLDDEAVARDVHDRVVARTTTVPVMIGVVVHQAEDPEVREEDWATAFMAIENLCLAAVEMGLGSHIKTGAVLREPALRDALGVAEGQRLAAVVFLGEPAEMPAHKPRAAVSDVTRWLD